MRFTLHSTVGLFSQEGNYFKRKISTALRKREMNILQQADGSYIAVQSVMPKSLKLYDPDARKLIGVKPSAGMTPGYPLETSQDVVEAYERYGA